MCFFNSGQNISDYVREKNIDRIERIFYNFKLYVRFKKRNLSSEIRNKREIE